MHRNANEVAQCRRERRPCSPSADRARIQRFPSARPPAFYESFAEEVVERLAEVGFVLARDEIMSWLESPLTCFGGA